MRRYIFAAIVALFSLTSCIVDDGYTPSTDNSSKMIYQRTTGFIYEMCTMCAGEVIYADALLRGDSATAEVVRELFFKDYTATINGNDVVLIPNTNTYYYMTIKTDGKPLAQGGQWSVYLNVMRNPRLVCKGVIGENGAFRVQSENTNISNSNIYDHTLRYTITEGRSLAITVVGSGEIRDVKNFTMQYRIDDQKPLVYKDFNLQDPAEGTLSVDYRDEQKGFSKSVKGIVANGTVLFE